MPDDTRSSQPIRLRVAALIEVSVAFALMHIAFRSLKRFTSLGQLEYQYNVNFSPAVAMLIVAAALITCRRQSFAEYAITPRPWPRSVNAGIVAFIVFALIGAVAITCGLRKDPTWTNLTNALVIAVLNLVFTAVLAMTLRRIDPSLDRGPRWLGIATILALLSTPIVIRLMHGQLVEQTAMEILSFVVLAAVGEEVFFRGYVQSRLNEAFGRPWQWFGIPFGPGLAIASLLFGFIHLLNTYDYFEGAGRLNWLWGLTTATAIAYGLLREKTGSIVAPMILHALVNLAGRLPEWVSP